MTVKIFFLFVPLVNFLYKFLLWLNNCKSWEIWQCWKLLAEILWVMTPHNWLGKYQPFGVTHCLCFQGLLQNIGTCLPHSGWSHSCFWSLQVSVFWSTVNTAMCHSFVMCISVQLVLSVISLNSTYLLTYSMVQNPSWEANWFAASQEIPRILWNLKVHNRTHKRLPPVPILCQPNPVHIPTFQLL